MDGLAKIPELLDRCRQYKMNALALTDHGAMYGAIKFYLACKDSGIKPIIGCEFYQAHRSRFDKQPHIDADQYHLVLLAKDWTGYQNLMKLTTIAHLEGFYYKARIDFAVLRRYNQGLICLTGCIEGEIPHLLRVDLDNKAEEKAKELMEIFPDGDFYFELQAHPKIADQDKVNKKMISLAQKLGVPLVATNDIHYVNPEDAQVQEILLCLQTQKELSDKTRTLSMIGSPDFYFRSPEEMTGLFIQYPEAIENTAKIAQRCNLEIPLNRWILPEFPVPEGQTAETYLKKLAYERLSSRFVKITEEVKKRLDYELDIICEKKFATYFLIVSDFVNWAKEKGIRVGPGRGSVAGSLVSYVLRITSLDPLEHNIPFERFLNPERPSPPDIDLDFADDRRDEVIAYVTDKYGKNKVAQIITFGTMEARQAIRDVGRVLGFPYSLPDRLAKLIPPGAQGFPMTIEKALNSVPELLEMYQTNTDIRRILDLARKLEGVARHSSTHAAGVVIADKPLTEYTPLQKEVKGERIITQYDMYALDLNAAGPGRAVGLLKMDFLGLRNLTILEKAMKYVKEIKNLEIDISSIPLDCAKVYEMISRGETTGVFQLESTGMRRLARHLQPTKFSDLAAMVALFRPGPMEWINEFVAVKNNPSKIRYPHPDLKPILAETYGIAVYQEQCLQMAVVLAGYTWGEADNLRRAIGKKKKEMMEKEKVRFLKKAVDKGYSRMVAEKVFALIEKFAGYGFNKAHATSYALIAYQTAYMKANFPVEFMAAVLTAESQASGPQRDEKTALAIEECRRVGILVLPPDIDKSKDGFSIEEGAIRLGLKSIKNVGSAAISIILASREKAGTFKNLVDFCQRVDLQKVNKKTLESLIKAGTMDNFGKKASMLSGLDKILLESHREKKRGETGQQTLFKPGENDPVLEFKLPEVEEFSKQEILFFQRELFGFFLSEHPMAKALEEIQREVTHLIADLTLEESGQRVKVGGIITSVKKITTKKDGSEMAFIKIEDKTGSIEVVVFPRIYQTLRENLIKDRAVIVSGRVDNKEDRLTIIAEKGERI